MKVKVIPVKHGVKLSKNLYVLRASNSTVRTYVQ